MATPGSGEEIQVLGGPGRQALGEQGCSPALGQREEEPGGFGLRAGLRRPPVSAMPVEYLTPAIEDRAVKVLGLPADRQHRAPSVPGLLIAATAELAGLTVLRCDKEDDLIAAVTGQPAEWLRTS